MIRVLIVDDHTVVRAGLKRILEDGPDVRVVAEAGSGAEALAFLRKESADVVLLDITMPGRSGIDVLKELVARKRHPAVMVLSVHPEEQYAIRVLKAGASGYLTKDSTPDELIAAVRKVSTGGKYVSPSLAERLAVHVEGGADGPRHAALSDREFEVMRLLASGLTVSEIAKKLSLSIKTVSTYRTRVIEKMGMKSNAQLAVYAAENGLLD